MREDWIEITFNDVSKSLKRGPFGGSLKKAFFVPDGYKVYEQQHAIKKDYQLGSYFIDDRKYQELVSFAVESGDYIVSCSGTIGKLYRLPKEAPKGVINQALLKIELEDKLLSHTYFSYLFQSEQFQRKILSDARGTGMQNLAGMKEIKLVPVPIAPLPEQRAIVAKVEQLFSELDNGIANLKTAKAKLEIYRQAVLKKAFEGEWPSVELEEISDAVGGYAFKSSTFLEKSGKYQVIRIGNIRPGILRLKESPVFLNQIDEKVLDRYLLRGGDVLITLTGTRKKRDYGFTVVVDKPNLLLNQRLAYLRFNTQCLPKFFLYYSWTEPFKEQFFGSETGNVGQGNVGMKSIRKTIIPLPSIEEQKSIIYEIETRLSVCDNILHNIEEGLAKAEALRQSILKKAFEGKLLNQAELAACRQHPDWEPAEKLLERIKNNNNGTDAMLASQNRRKK